MAGNDDAFAFVLASARRTIEQLDGDSSVIDATEGRGAALAAHVRHMLALVEARVAATERSYPTAMLPAAQDAVIRNLRLYTQLARALHESLPWLNRASAATLDLGTHYFIDEMALAIVGRGAETVAVPNTSYMYSTLSWPFRLTALQYLNVDVATGTRPIVLFFPFKESDAVLLHALFAHELGHAAADQHGLVAQVIATAQVDPGFAAGLDAARDAIQRSMGLDAMAAERVVRARLAAWLEELLCDALALHYIGPSYLFAFSAFVLASNWTDPQPTHPPPTLRVRMLVDQLAALGWITWLVGIRPELGMWFDWVKETPLPPMAPDNSFLRDTVVRHAEAIRMSARERLGEHAYAPAAYAPYEADLHALLERRILPVELDGHAIDRRNILLAGWAYALRCRPDGTERDDGPAALSEALTETGLQRFIAKALELSTIADAWSGLP